METGIRLGCCVAFNVSFNFVEAKVLLNPDFDAGDAVCMSVAFMVNTEWQVQV